MFYFIGIKLCYVKSHYLKYLLVPRKGLHLKQEKCGQEAQSSIKALKIQAALVIRRGCVPEKFRPASTKPDNLNLNKVRMTFISLSIHGFPLFSKPRISRARITRAACICRVWKPRSLESFVDMVSIKFDVFYFTLALNNYTLTIRMIFLYFHEMSRLKIAEKSSVKLCPSGLSYAQTKLTTFFASFSSLLHGGMAVKHQAMCMLYISGSQPFRLQVPVVDKFYITVPVTIFCYVFVLVVFFKSCFLL